MGLHLPLFLNDRNLLFHDRAENSALTRWIKQKAPEMYPWKQTTRL